MIPNQTLVVIVALPGLVARLADTAPEPSNGLVLRGSRKLDLIHCMFLAKQLPAFPAVDTSVEGSERLLTYRVKAVIISRAALPVGPCHGEIRVPFLRRDAAVAHDGVDGRRTHGRDNVVGLEDIETLEFLVKNCHGLEGLCFQHAFSKPGADVVFFDLLDLLMDVVEVAAAVSIL